MFNIRMNVPQKNRNVISNCFIFSVEIRISKKLHFLFVGLGKEVLSLPPLWEGKDADLQERSS